MVSTSLGAIPQVAVFGSVDIRFTGGGVCGDGTLDPGEQCDDGNRTSGDGCSAKCESEFEILIDIKPGSDPNSINPSGEGVIPVAILGSSTFSTFDVTEVDVTTLAFGPDGAFPVHDLTVRKTFKEHLKRVNGDRLKDLVSHYETQETGIAFGDTAACVTGETLDGTPFVGCDSVQTSP